MELDTTVQEKMNVQLIAPLMGEKLRNVAASLPHNSCLVEDGLTPIFFLKYWELMEENLVLAFQHMFLERFMPSSIAKGMIFLILKGEDPSENIHVTILNTIYEMIAKVLSLRLLPFLNI